MYCSSCGAQIPDGARYCARCGAEVTKADTSEESTSSQTSHQPSGQTAYAEGCVTTTLRDLRSNKGWMGKMVILGLINCVPILNFVVDGYALNWARELPLGRRTQLPRPIVTGHNFEIGFYAFLIGLVASLVTGVGALLNLIPVLGFLAFLAFSILVTMFVSLLNLRMAIKEQLGEGFRVGEAWNVLQRNWPALFCAAFIPQLIAGLISGVLSLLFTLFGAVVGLIPDALFSGLDTSSYSAGFEYFLGAGAIGFAGVSFIITFLINAFLSAAAQVISIRAVGYWISRYAPEWAQPNYGYSNGGYAR